MIFFILAIAALGLMVFAVIFSTGGRRKRGQG